MSLTKLSAKGVGAIREGWSVVGTLDSRTFLRESKYPADNVQVHTWCTGVHTVYRCTHGVQVHTRCTGAHTVYRFTHGVQVHTRCTGAHSVGIDAHTV